MQFTAPATKYSHEDATNRRLNTTYSGTVSQLHTQVPLNHDRKGASYSMQG